jgi:hypothetical protein
VAVSPPASGTASIGGGGSVTYTPKLGFAGADAFVYTVDDGRGGTDTAVVTITVDEVQVNLVGNPGFETDTSGWETTDPAVSLTRVAGGHTGDWAAEVANTSSLPLKCRMEDAPNWVGVTSAGTYTVSVWVRGDDANVGVGGKMKLRIREFAGGQLVGAVYVTEPLTTTWLRISLPYTVLSPGSTLDVSVSRYDALPGTCFYADDVSIVLSSASGPPGGPAVGPPAHSPGGPKCANALPVEWLLGRKCRDVDADERIALPRRR